MIEDNDIKERNKRYCKKYYEKHKEQLSTYKKEYYEKYKDIINEKARKKYQENNIKKIKNIIIKDIKNGMRIIKIKKEK